MSAIIHRGDAETRRETPASKWDLLRMFPTWSFLQTPERDDVILTTTECPIAANVLVMSCFWCSRDQVFHACNFFLN